MLEQYSRPVIETSGLQNSDVGLSPEDAAILHIERLHEPSGRMIGLATRMASEFPRLRNMGFDPFRHISDYDHFREAFETSVILALTLPQHAENFGLPNIDEEKGVELLEMIPVLDEAGCQVYSNFSAYTDQMHHRIEQTYQSHVQTSAGSLSRFGFEFNEDAFRVVQQEKVHWITYDPTRPNPWYTPESRINEVVAVVADGMINSQFRSHGPGHPQSKAGRIAAEQYVQHFPQTAQDMTGTLTDINRRLFTDNIRHGRIRMGSRHGSTAVACAARVETDVAGRCTATINLVQMGDSGFNISYPDDSMAFAGYGNALLNFPHVVYFAGMERHIPDGSIQHLGLEVPVGATLALYSDGMDILPKRVFRDIMTAGAHIHLKLQMLLWGATFYRYAGQESVSDRTAVLIHIPEETGVLPPEFRATAR